MNHSEAGPDIATGLTSSDLKCASQFLKDEDSQLRSLSSSLDGQCKVNDESFNDHSRSSTEEFATPPPPREERSAPEGTSSPDPKAGENSDSKLKSDTLIRQSEVKELLQKQERMYERKLLRQSLIAAEKEEHFNTSLQGDLAETQAALKETTASRDALLKLVEQYKGMLSALVAEKEKKQREQLSSIKTVQMERDQALEDINNVEAAFADVHRKYERTKQIVDTLRRNEETLRKAVSDYESKLLANEKKRIELQEQAEQKLAEAADDYESLQRANDQEMTKMTALLKKAEMKIISLQEGLDRKTRENQELTQLCDDLISKVGT